MNDETTINMMPLMHVARNRASWPLSVIAVALIAWTMWPLAIVPAGHRGVMTTMGKPSDEVLGEGVHLHMPFIQKMHLMDIRLAKNEGQGEAASKDLQAVQAKVGAEQQKLKADRDLQRIQVEAEQRIASARAEAEGLRLQRLEVTPLLLDLRRVENDRLAIAKWNGQLPTTSVGAGAQPFIALPAAR